jgi:hypothetical protein
MGILSGLLGGSQKTEVKLPSYITDASQDALSLADRLAAIGYVPNYGPDVAAFTPMQEAGFQNTNRMAAAFGMGSGRQAMAIAVIARCNCPPETWCGYRNPMLSGSGRRMRR